MELRTQNAQLVGGPAISILSSMVFDCKFCTRCLKLWSSELDPDDPVELFFNRTPRSQNHGNYPSKRIPGGQNYGSYCSKRPKPWKLSLKTKPQRPSGRSSHGNRSPVAICRSFQKIQKYRVIFPRQNVANFNTKLITFWPIAQRTIFYTFWVAKNMGAIAYCFGAVSWGPKLWELLLNWPK